MSMDRETVRHVARLARLGLDAEEEESLARELSDILDHIARLNELETADVPPTYHVLALTNVLREDETRPSLAPTEALQNAPEAVRGFFRVPPIVEDRDE